jgi:hypothetical protein
MAPCPHVQVDPPESVERAVADDCVTHRHGPSGMASERRRENRAYVGDHCQLK